MDLLIDLEVSSVDFSASIIGNKAYNLALMASNHKEVNFPKSVILPSTVKIEEAGILDSVVKEVCDCVTFPVIMRSSTSVEDSGNSFAGLFESEICYESRKIADCVRYVKASAETEQVKEYAKIVGVDFDKIKSAVLIQEYKKAEMSGVLFTKNPVTNDDKVIYIEYKENSSDSVTGGYQTPSSLMLNKNSYKNSEFPFADLCDIAIKAEKQFGYPLDIEYIVSNDKLWIVQVRQITT